MGVLSDQDIERELEIGRLKISPYPKRINPASVELTLGHDILYLKRTMTNEIDLRKPFPEDMVDRFEMDRKRGFSIKPGEHYLATTDERVELPDDITLYVVGKSSIGRIGLVPVTAGYVDPGFGGQITLEIYNVGHTPVIIYPGMFFAQGVFYYLNSPAKNPYNKRKTSLYHGQKGTTLPKTSNLFPDGWEKSSKD
jgi:dCTP deaminase